MKNNGLLGALLAVLVSVSAVSQGWQTLGPDLPGWSDVRQMSITWTSATDFEIAVATSNGVAFRSNSSSWDYRLGNGSPNYFIHAEFSPWNHDSIFLGTSVRTGQLEYFLQLRRRHYPSLLNPPTGSPPWGVYSYPLVPLSMFFSGLSDSTCLADISGAIWKSANRGRTWEQKFNQPVNYSFRLIRVEGSRNSAFGTGTPYSQFNYSLLARSTNFGESWDSLYYTNTRFRCVFAEGDTFLAGAVHPTFDSTSLVGIFRTTNNGVAWQQVYTGGQTFGIAKSQTSYNTLFAGSEQGVLRSTDLGLTWTTYNNTLPTTRLTSLAISPFSDTMFVSTETHGILKVWNYLTGVDEQRETPARFELMQNSPNPFNPETRIGFRVSGAGLVSLNVYDVLGREVATLVNEEMWPGTYERIFDARGLASGVYLYRLQARGFMQTRNLLLLK